jgi:hypothetical protein
MTQDLKDLLSLIRQHPAFRELLQTLPSYLPKQFKQSADADKQFADWIFNSGRAVENERWRRFLIEANPSDKETL